MGKVNIDRQVHFSYGPKLLYWWGQQPESIKEKFNEVGEPYGYSGMEVFYLYTRFIIMKYRGNYDIEPWEVRAT